MLMQHNLFCFIATAGSIDKREYAHRKNRWGKAQARPAIKRGALEVGQARRKPHRKLHTGRALLVMR
jgi:hypothetical protein